MQLTEKEEQIMKVLWDLEHAFVKEIIEKLPSPKPHYNTVSTFIRIMEDKGIVGHETFGKSHRYYPILQQSAYKDSSINKILDGYFGKSFKGLVAHFAKEEKISIQELKEIIKMIEKEDK